MGGKRLIRKRAGNTRSTRTSRRRKVGTRSGGTKTSTIRKIVLSGPRTGTDAGWWWVSYLKWSGWAIGQLITMAVGALTNDTKDDTVDVKAVGYLLALSLGPEDLVMDDPSVGLGPSSTSRSWNKSWCLASWRQARVHSVTVRVIPTCDLTTRGGTVVVALHPITEYEALSDGASKRHAWLYENLTPEAILRLPGAKTFNAARTNTMSLQFDPSSWAGEWHEMGVPGTELTAVGAGAEYLHRYVNADGAYGGPPVCRLVVLFQDFSSATSDVAHYNPENGTFRVEIRSSVSLREKVGSGGNKWKVDNTGEETEVTNYQCIRHRPISLAQNYPDADLATRNKNQFISISDSLSGKGGVALFSDATQHQRADAGNVLRIKTKDIKRTTAELALPPDSPSDWHSVERHETPME